MTAPTLCAAKLRDGSGCRTVPAVGDLCEHHTRLAAELGRDNIIKGDHAKRRSARQRVPVIAEAEPVELTTHSSGRPSSVRPALALAAAAAQVLEEDRLIAEAFGNRPPTVFERSYAKVYEDAQDMEETRSRLASIGFGVRSVDQSLTSDT